MTTNNVPRLDDSPCELYKIFWDIINLNLLHIYQEAIQIGSLSSIINKGNILFIPKIGDPELITNWRMINLLNTSYKIITKVIALKLHPLLLMII